jgi:hypothetical protein
MWVPRRDAQLSRASEIAAAYERLGSMAAVKKELAIPLTVVSEIVHREDLIRRRHRRPRYRYSYEELLTRLREAAKAHGGPLTIAAYERIARSSVRRRRSWPMPQTYYLRFGSWPEAISAAVLPAADWHRRGGHRYSREDCVTAVARAASHVGKEPTIREYDAWAKARDGVPSFTTVINRCGTWRTALRAAGLSNRRGS